MNLRIIRFLFGTVIAGTIAMLLLALPMPVTSAPLTTYKEISVNTATDEFAAAAPGASPCSLREAIKSFNDGVEFGGCAFVTAVGSSLPMVLLPSNTYTLTFPGSGEDLDATGDLDIRANMIISATGALTPTVTGDPNTWADRIFHILIGTVTIKHIAISRGNISSDGGGGVKIESGASLILSDSLIENNGGAFQGGGIVNYGTATLTNVTLSGNDSSSGGGIFNSLGALTLTNLAFISNTANYGAAIRNIGGALTLTGLTFLSNHATTYGGGVYNDGGTIALSNSTLENNRGDNNGGGIYLLGGSAVLTNVTLVSNSATGGNGGGIYANSTTMLTNVTLSGNHANTFGGGIFNSDLTTLTNVTLYGNSGAGEGGISNQGGTMTLTNTIVANSTGGNCGGTLGGSFNLSDDNNCGFNANSGQDNANLKLLPLGNYGGPTLTHMPYGGPAIDHGTNTGCPSTDQRGKPRPVNVTCDVGAVERQLVDYPFLYLPLILR